MGLIDTVIQLNQRHKRALQEQRKALAQMNRDGRIASDSTMELSSVDMTVAFFADHLEFRRRLGSKHGAILYAELESVRLAEHSSTIFNVTPNDAPAASHPRKEVILVVSSRAEPLTFDFRAESEEKVSQAMALMRRGMQRGAHDESTGGHAAFSRGPRSRADELTTLAQLRSDGVLTEAEFETEKARILNSE